MNTGSRLVLAVVAGGAVGALWRALYLPAVHPLPLLVLGHVLATLIFARALSWLPGAWRGPAPLLLGVVLGLVLAPAGLEPLHAAGLLGGKAGLAIDAAAMVALAGLGALAGCWIPRSGWRRGLGLLLPLVALGAVLGARLIPPRGAEAAPPTAAKVGADFPKQKVAIIGIDGADWAVAEPLIARGLMPTLAALRERGRWGVLRSIEPTYSPVVWTTIFSGHNPETHGLVDWYRADARSRRVPMLWDIFGAHGRSSLTANVPGSWPPAPVQGGVLLSGFPIPGLTTGDKGQLLGAVVSTIDEQGDVPTYRARALEDGRFVFDLPIAAPEIEARFSGLRHPVLDALVRKQWVIPAGHRLRATAIVEDGQIRLEGETLAAPVSFDADAWSGWIRVHDGDLDAVLQAHALPSGADGLRLFFTPAYQAPWNPRFEFRSGLDDERFWTRGEPYVSEGLGWMAHRDARVAALVPAALEMVEAGHVSTVERLLFEREPDLVNYVITMTDRLQHPFWSLRGGAADAPAGLEGEDPIADGYAFADGALGRILRQLPEDTLVFVVSDHGADADDSHGEGTHRLEGLWVAAGPPVATSPEPLELGVADIVPTVLRCVGAPVATDFAGKASEALCPAVPVAPTVPTYRGELDDAAHDVRIDASREEQLKALGYLEEDE